MNPLVKKTLFWFPRVFTIVFALFLIIFSFDVFEHSANVGQLLLALLIHNIPTILILLIVYFSWRREWIAGILLPLLGLIHLVWGFGKFPFLAYLLTEGPLYVVGALYLLNWRWRKILRPDTAAANLEKAPPANEGGGQ
ncbi:MAG: hypothetical protein V2A56_03535 [bacterium]